jgi:hypothetical protein
VPEGALDKDNHSSLCIAYATRMAQRRRRGQDVRHAADGERVCPDLVPLAQDEAVPLEELAVHARTARRGYAPIPGMARCGAPAMRG